MVSIPVYPHGYVHPPRSGWCERARRGSRKRITTSAARPQPLHDGVQRWMADGSAIHLPADIAHRRYTTSHVRMSRMSLITF